MKRNKTWCEELIKIETENEEREFRGIEGIERNNNADWE